MVRRVNYDTDSAQRRLLTIVIVNGEKKDVEDKENSIEQVDGSMSGTFILYVTLAGMYPQWLAMVGTNHHSDKITTTKNSLSSTKISENA